MLGCVGVLGIHCTFAVWVSAYHNSWYAHNNSTQTYNIKVMWPKPQTACLQKIQQTLASAQCGECMLQMRWEIPLVVFTWWESKLSYCYKAKSFIFHWIFIYLCRGVFFYSVSTFYIYMAKFWETVVYKNDPLWFILFSRQIWYRIWVWAAVYKLKKHERCFYRICWKKISCSAPDGNRIAEMFRFIHSPPKKTLKEKNVTSGVIFLYLLRAVTGREVREFSETSSLSRILLIYTDVLRGLNGAQIYRQPAPGTAKVLDFGGWAAITKAAASAPCGCSAT